MQKNNFTTTRISHFPRPAVIVTSKNNKGEVGATTISWCGVVSSQPQVLSISFLPDSFTRGCIIESREFVINIPSDDLIKETNFLGSISGEWDKKMQEMQKQLNTILTQGSSQKIKSPIINECYMHFECRLLNTIQVGLYDCFLGLVLNMSCNTDLYSTELHPKGNVNYSEVKPIICLADEYWNTGKFLGKSTENKNHPHGNTH